MEAYAYPADQSAVYEADFEQPVVNLGAHADNDLVLPADQALPFHATLVVEGEGVRLVRADAAASITVDGLPLTEPTVLLHSGQSIGIGDHTLFIQRLPTPYGLRVSVYAAAPSEAPMTAEEDSQAILLQVITGEAETAVEQSAYFEVEVVNAGPLVARFTLSLRGAPAEWVEITPNSFNLNEGRSQRVRIRVTPPRSPESEAGDHQLQLVVVSPNYPGQQASAALHLTIQPYYDFAVGNLSPKNQRIPWRKHSGLVVLPIKNLSNTAADFMLSASDDENGCSFDFLLDEEVQLSKQASVRLQRYESIELPIQITPLRQPVFAWRSKRYHYAVNVQIPQQAAAPQILSGMVQSQPLFGWWSILLGALAVLLGLFFLLQPKIYTFEVAAGKDVIEQGDTTKLVWRVSPFATRISLSNVEQPIRRDEVSRVVSPPHSTTYELTAGNWLSSLFGLDQKRTVTVLVVPPSPRINAFSVDRTTISKGQTVRIRWSVSDAEEALLTIDDVVYQLSPEEFSGEREVLLEKDALVTLEARSASGSELQSYFVNVTPPSIRINTFAVWVRSDDVALRGADPYVRFGGRLFSPVNAPDPNFPVKFVELVPDPESDNGYSVWFNPDVREELQKGEQIILEWDIEGADSVQIAPFTDVLPARGSQPFFPQESMNFVLTAQSGDLEAIYMLPVKVFDGEPPKAPTIEFFTASPSRMVGAGDVQFAWSISGEWTRVQITSGDTVIADYLNPQGFKTVRVEKTSSFILTAWNGQDLSSAKIIEVVVDPALKPLDLTISQVLPEVSYFKVGDSVDVFVDIKDPETGEAPNPYPSGIITVSDGRAICTITLPTRMCRLVFNAAGAKTGDNAIKASYPGDSIYLPADSEPFTGRTIIVESNKVELNPRYYHLNQDGQFADPINDLSNPSPPISVGRGLGIEVNVVPVNQPLVVGDTDGRVTVRYCPVQNGEIQLQDCTSLLPAVVEVLSPDSGIANITIDHFPKAGQYALIIDYSHNANAYDPVSLGNDGSLAFTVEAGNLILIPDGLDPCDDNQCTMIQGQNEYIFYPWIAIENGWNKPLVSTYPQPGALLINLTWKSTGTSSDWSSNCNWQKSGDRWMLYCSNVDMVDDNYFSYALAAPDENYSVTHGPIDIKIKYATKIAFPDPTFLNNRYVGSDIALQSPDNVMLLNAETNQRIDGDILLTLERNGAQVANILEYLIIANDAPTCNASGDTLTIPQQAAVSGNCHIAFKYAGDYTLNFRYEGSTLYDSTTASRTVTIQKQIGIAATVTPNVFTWPVFTDVDRLWEFSCPSTEPSCQDFVTSPTAIDAIFAGARMELALTNLDSCTLRQGTTALSNGQFTLASHATTLTFRCSQPESGNGQLFFATPSNASFALASGDGPYTIVVTPLDVSSSPRIEMETGSNTFDLVGDPNDAIVDGEWWVGEKYRAFVTISSIPEDAAIDNDYVEMTMPLDLKSALDMSNTTCTWLEDTTSTSRFEVPLAKSAADPTVWEASCTFVFQQTTAALNDVISFRFITTRFADQTANRDIAVNAAVSKRPVSLSLAIDPTQPPDPAVYALSGPVVKITISDNHYQYNAVDNWQANLSVTVNGAVLDVAADCQRKGDVIECAFDDTTTGNRNITVSYASDAIFQGSNATTSVTLEPVPVSLSLSGDFPIHMACQYLDCVSLNKWPFGGQDVAFTDTTYSLQFTLQPEINAVTAPVEGKVIITLNSNGTPCDISIVNGTAYKLAGQCAFETTLSQGQADFQWQFNTNDLLSYSYFYDYDNNGSPFVKGSNGWPTSATAVEIYQEITFSVGACGPSNDGFDISPLTPTLNGYAVHLEIDPNGGLNTPLTCESNTLDPCWDAGDYVYRSDTSPANDGCVLTDPVWNDVVNFNVPYQLILRDVTSGANFYLGWKQVP